ncbi:hypothetical protein HKX48_002807 [Thoreauomyces humboldtii]|nr:hypothetical protein HKX48_002807 [Thoreauomyces humboldtii]
MPALEHSPTQIVRTCFKAYLSGYLIETGPKLASLLVKLCSPRGNTRRWSVVLRMIAVLGAGVKGRWPTFMLVLLGGFRLLDQSAWVALKLWQETRRSKLVSTGVVLTDPRHRHITRACSDNFEEHSEGGLTLLIDDGWRAGNQTEHLAPSPETMDLPVRFYQSVFNPTVVAATVSSALALLIIEPAKRPEFALFALVRAADSVVSYEKNAIRSTLQRAGVPRFVINNGATSVFVAACTQIMYCWFLFPQALPKVYTNWITRMGRMDPNVKQAYHDFGHGTMVSHKDTGHADVLGDVAHMLGMPRAAGNPVHGHIPCGVFHSGRGCVEHLAKTWVSGMRDSAKIYILVHLLPVLLFRRNRLLDAPRATLISALRGTAVSANFLASFIVITWMPLCAVRNLRQRDGMTGPLVGAALSGFSILLEHPSRRREIAVYVVPKALESLWWRLSNGKMLRMPRIPRAEFAMFAGGMGYILSGLTKPNALRPAVRSSLAFFLD